VVVDQPIGSFFPNRSRILQRNAIGAEAALTLRLKNTWFLLTRISDEMSNNRQVNRHGKSAIRGIHSFSIDGWFRIARFCIEAALLDQANADAFAILVEANLQRAGPESGK
jgi:hypothetical protein